MCIVHEYDRTHRRRPASSSRADSGPNYTSRQPKVGLLGHRTGIAMTHHFHSVVYIDHSEAVIFEFSADDMTEARIRPADHQGNIHHKAGSVGSGHAPEDKTYFSAVIAALQPSHEILIVGHGTEKTEFAHFIRDHVPSLAPRIMGVETVAQPTKREIVALARKFFDKKDNMTPQR
jgi:hypothetical protein